MILGLLDYICCPACQGQLSCLNPPPDSDTEIENSLLLCAGCERWYPVRGFIPELLPDQLRDWDRDIQFLDKLKSKFTLDVHEAFSKSVPEETTSADDTGIRYKQAEIHIEDKVDNSDFFGPGYVAPFNPGNTEFTIQLIKRLGNALPLLELKPGDVVLDICAGYAWTTEWLKNMGTEAIAIDICRTYMDIAIERLGSHLPHLILGDIENLPLKAKVLDAVLSYDAFHHIYDRKQAMQHFSRALKDEGRMVLAEPGGAHEHAEGPKEVMDKYGILEKGMELEDVKNYCEGLDFLPPEQHFVIKIRNVELKKKLKLKFVQEHTYVDCNLFLLKKVLDQT
jgi:uncharacterized protein YbaR (Trm112 family)/2-polyprenyl-3-methyl-5-hydroxy-6-metoxy-1,4-benzoquinol methylase